MGTRAQSDKVGVCAGDLGTGVTNAVTGIATAYMDSIPMVIITGQVPTHAIGLDAFQECDTVVSRGPALKHNFLVKEVKDLAVTIKKAFYLARTGPARPCARRHSQGRHVGQVPIRVPGDVTCVPTIRLVKGHPVRSGRPCSCSPRRSAPDDLTPGVG